MALNPGRSLTRGERSMIYSNALLRETVASGGAEDGMDHVQCTHGSQGRTGGGESTDSYEQLRLLNAIVTGREGE